MRIFKGWVVACLLKGEYYTQIETLRETRREAIEKTCHLVALRESGGWKDYADAAERKKIWAKRRKAGDIVVRATLEAEEV